MTARPQPETDAEQLQRRTRELVILNSFAQALNRSVNLDQALDVALAQVVELFDLKTGWVWLLEEETGQPYLAGALNLPPGLVKNPRLMEGSCYCLDTYRAGDLNGAANVNVITCSRLKKLVGGTSGLRYHASIPLYAHGRPLGVFNVASTGWSGLSAEDLRLLYTVGDLLSIAIERARLFSRSAEFGAAEERSRLAREIHDTLAQGLAGISLQLETAEALIETGAGLDKIRQAIHQALELARANLDEARRSVLDLRAAPLEERGLSGALAELAGRITARGQVSVSFEATGSAQALPLRVETGLYRIAQEALTNVEQHSGTGQAALRLGYQPGSVTLVVEDHGQGFDPALREPGHFGILGLSERVRLLGGSLDLATAPGEGTRVTVTLPLKQPA